MNKNVIKVLGAILLIVVFSLVAVFTFGYLNNRTKEERMKKINSFAECADAGYPILESYPEQCKTPDGRTFIKDISVTITPIN